MVKLIKSSISRYFGQKKTRLLALTRTLGVCLSVGWTYLGQTKSEGGS